MRQDRRASRKNRRRGGISIYALVVFPVLLLAAMLALNAAWIVEAKTTLRGSTEAAGLATAGALADDDYLRGDDDSIRRLLDRASKVGIHFANRNPTLGDPLRLQPNAENDPDGDIVFGFWQGGQGFRHAPWQDGKCQDGKHIDAVRICGRRLKKRGNPIRLLGGLASPMCLHDAEACTIVHLDGRILGFRQCFDDPIPLCPIAIRSGMGESDPDTWEYSCQQKRGRDEWSHSSQNRKFEQDRDGITEMRGRFSHEKVTGNRNAAEPPGNGNKDSRGGNLCLLQLGADSAESFRRQVAEGLNSDDLREHGGELRLRSDRTLPVSGRWWKPEANSELLAALIGGLEELRRSAAPRIWPLYVRTDGVANVTLSGFVAARVVHVDLNDATGDLQIILQPARMVTKTAITPVSHTEGSAQDEVNPYIVKLRLVE